MPQDVHDIRSRQAVAFKKSQSILKELLIILLIAGVFFGIYNLTFQVAQVHGTSMYQTLQDGDLLLTTKVPYYFSDPARGDIVIVNSAVDQTVIVKRVIGLPGDTIEINGTGSKAKIEVKPKGQNNWQILNEPYLPDTWTVDVNCCDSTGRATAKPNPVVIPAEEFFVLGDNRNVSKDSRYIGFIPKNQILSKVLFRFWPLSRFGGLGSGSTLAPMAAMFMGFLWRRKKILLALKN